MRTLQCEPEVTRVLRCHCRRCSAHARNRSHFHDSCREVLLRLHMRRRALPTWTKQHRPSTSADQRAKQPSMDKLAIATRATSPAHRCACTMRGSPLQPTIIARFLQPTCKHPQALRLQHLPSSMPSRASRRRSATDIVFCAHLPMRGAGLLESLPQLSGGRGAGVPLSFESDNPFADSDTGSCRGCP